MDMRKTGHLPSRILTISVVLVISITVILWLFYFRSSLPKQPAPPTIKSRKIDAIRLQDYTIRLQRTPCYGPCPVYVVTVSGDGRVRFDSEDRRRGRFTPRPAPRFVRERQLTHDEHMQLARMIEQGEFWKLKSRYELEPFRDEQGRMMEVAVTDNPSVTLSVTRQHESKSVYQHIVPCQAAKPLRNPRDDVTKAIRTYVPDTFCGLVEMIDILTCAAYWGRQAIPQSPSSPDPGLLVQPRCETTP